MQQPGLPGACTAGSGKTHTMMGNLTANEAGVIPRLCAHLFARIEAMKALRPYSFKVEAMYCEIYNEKVRFIVTVSLIASLGCGVMVHKMVVDVRLDPCRHPPPPFSIQCLICS